MTGEEKLGELTYRNLLVAVDGSEPSDLALSAAISAVRHNNAKVTLIAVAPEVRTYAVPSAQLAAPALQDDVDTATDRVLRDAIAKIPDDVPVTTVFRHGRPGPEIVAYAADEGNDFDAIVLGARGVGRLAGSVSRYVLHHATIAVIVAHPPARRD